MDVKSTPKRRQVTLTIPLESVAAKQRLLKTARRNGRKLATWARETLIAAAREL